MIFANFHYFFWKKNWIFFNFQLFVCPCYIPRDSEHKQINLYLDKKIYGKSLYVILNGKELGELLHCFCNENKEKCGFCDKKGNCIYYKKLHIRQCLDNAYYFSPRKDTPWQPNCYKVFLYHQIDKEFENIQKPDFNFRVEIKYVRKSWTIDCHNSF